MRQPQSAADASTWRRVAVVPLAIFRSTQSLTQLGGDVPRYCSAACHYSHRSRNCEGGVLFPIRDVFLSPPARATESRILEPG